MGIDAHWQWCMLYLFKKKKNHFVLKTNIKTIQGLHVCNKKKKAIPYFYSALFFWYIKLMQKRKERKSVWRGFKKPLDTANQHYVFREVLCTSIHYLKVPLWAFVMWYDAPQHLCSWCFPGSHIWKLWLRCGLIPEPSCAHYPFLKKSPSKSKHHPHYTHAIVFQVTNSSTWPLTHSLRWSAHLFC